MAEKFAKWIGGALGWALGGPIGALIGFSLGYLWDSATLLPATTGQRRERFRGDETRQGDFAVSLLVLTAAVMKADDRVLKSELSYVRAFLLRQFGETQTSELLRVLRDLLQRDIPLEPVCTQIRMHMSQPQRLQLLHFLGGIANADGTFHRSEWTVIESIARLLGISKADLQSIEAMYELDEDRYYRILEMPNTATRDEVKAAYRKMAKKYHPDRLGDVGTEVRNAAVEKFRQVQEAYDKLMKKQDNTIHR